jgi:hypothetical protein
MLQLPPVQATSDFLAEHLPFQCEVTAARSLGSASGRTRAPGIGDERTPGVVEEMVSLDEPFVGQSDRSALKLALDL